MAVLLFTFIDKYDFIYLKLRVLIEWNVIDCKSESVLASISELS